MPVRLSDGSDVQDELRNGQVHCLMWCATGSGWESEPPPLTLEQVAAHCSDGKRPRVVIVCLRFGAQLAARLLREIGAPTVIWMQVDMLSKKAELVLCSVVVKVLAQLDKLHTEKDVHALVAKQCALAELDDVCFGCVSHRSDSNMRWVRPITSETASWLASGSRPRPLQKPETNLRHDKPSTLLACDLASVDRLRKSFAAEDENKRLQCLSGDAERCHAVATEVCLSLIHI